jgi:peptidoglycan-associated lipoprotein
MKLNHTIWALAISALLLNGCADTEDKDTDLLGGDTDNSGLDGASTSGLNGGSGVDGSTFGGKSRYGSGGSASNPDFSDPSSPLSKRVIYFTLDSFQIQEDYVSVIAAHAQYLAANPSQRIVLEGHGDERGSREYNIALGEQRAKAVASVLKIQGVSESQISIVSYGEEKPAAYGSDESAWEQNRRVEINY